MDKSKIFETFAGVLENAPMIKACRLSAECRLVNLDKGYWRPGDHVAEAWSIGKKYKP